MIKSDLYIYAGIEPGKKGAGNFVSFFIDKLNEKEIKFELKYNKTPDGFVVNIAKRLRLHKILRQIYYSLSQRILSNIVKIKDSKIILLHPQSIGLKLTSELILNNKIYYYVLDNFFFCKKSYNYLKGNNSCTLCIDNSRSYIEEGCNFFPNKANQNDYDLLLKTIKSNLKNIVFLTQNKNQSLLIKAKFGDSVKIKELGMLINLLKTESVESNGFKKYDFVYHNTLSEAKGLLYFIKLAKEMPSNSFFIPYSKIEVFRVLGSFNDLVNLDFISMTWSTGLSEVIQKSKVIINPSLWSSPVEGALLKSIFYNGCVAVVSTNYSFQSEIPNDVVLKLSENIKESASLLSNLLISEYDIRKLKESSKSWVNFFIKDVNVHFDKFLKDEFI